MGLHSWLRPLYQPPIIFLYVFRDPADVGVGFHVLQRFFVDFAGDGRDRFDESSPTFLVCYFNLLPTSPCVASNHKPKSVSISSHGTVASYSCGHSGALFPLSSASCPPSSRHLCRGNALYQSSNPLLAVSYMVWSSRADLNSHMFA